MQVKILSKKTKGGLFVQFDITEPGEEETTGLMIDPPGDFYTKLLRLEEEMRASGEICDSPDTGLQERVEPMSDSSFVVTGYYELRDEAASETLISRLESVFPAADIDVEYL